MKLLARFTFVLVALFLSVLARAAQAETVHANLRGFEETPQTISTGAGGEFHAKILKDSVIEYQLSYFGLEGAVTQAHIHFGRRGLTGGISVWLCGTGSNPGPTGTPSCPTPGGTVTGTAIAANVIGPAGQGISAGQLAEIINAIRAGATYANVHSTLYPSGEIRGQIRRGSEQK